MNNLILFDFDGTITTRDSLKKFLIFYHGWFKVSAGLLALSPFLILYVLKIISNNTAKQILLQWFFNHEPVDIFNQKCKTFALQCIPKMLRPAAVEQINYHKNNQETIVVVTASAENWVKPWCEEMNLLCIGTNLEVKANKLTGKYLGKNCYGPEKVNRIKEQFNLSAFDKIIAYGDSRGDREMFALANPYYYKTFPLT
ncbi:MAG TPA: HAD family hydrolase [Cyclobacteriaceae bacterium]|nr:HAD family hydrolase [Cyclobacteriaceae bacterium]HRJ83521.1 HAD family hydrolase [Cyclobacteriaceae bacterium]